MRPELHVQLLELELEAAKMKADGYRRLLLPFLGDADATRPTTSMHPASESQQTQTTSARAPVSTSAPGGTARLERLIRTSRREAADAIVARQPMSRARRPTGPQVLISRSECPGGTSSHVRVSSHSSSHPEPVPTSSGSTSQRQQPPCREQRRQTLAVADTLPEVVRCGNLESDSDRVFVGTIATLCADNSPRNRTAIFSTAGLGTYQLEPQEAACARRTPDIPWNSFSSIFGGTMHSERPVCRKVPGYDVGPGNFLCTNVVTQPFAPTYVGEPGVILFSPDAPSLPETFHVLADPSVRGKTKLWYCGVYTRVHRMEVQIDEWHALPVQCRHKLLRQLQGTRVGDIHARCSLHKRKRYGSNPSPAEIQEWIQKYQQGSEKVGHRAIHDAFESGAEKFCFEVIRCTSFDVQLAELIQQGTN